MATISAKIIKRPRKARICEGYRHRVLMSVNEPHIRLYGSANGEPPYVIYVCMKCANESEDKKIKELLQKGKT